MLYLAQVHCPQTAAETTLKLLAGQTAAYLWEVLPDPKVITAAGAIAADGCLVLVEMDDQQHIQTVANATDWVIEIVRQYLTLGLPPAQLQQEIERAEQWRQSLTLEKQEVGRRVLETEARRDEMQALEANLKREKEDLERQRAELQALEQRLHQRETGSH